MSAHILSRRDRIATKLTFWVGSFFLIAALTLLAWVYTSQRKASLAELQRLAETNTVFLADLGLPYSTQLASQLSEILHLGVGFYFSDSPESLWPAEIAGRVRDLIKTDPEGASQRVGKWEIAVVPLVGRDGHLVLARNLEDEGNTTRAWWAAAAVPITLLAMGCLALAFGLGKSIATPLSTLTDWLPNLRDEEATAPDIPGGVTDRSDEIGRLASALAELKRELSEEKDRRARSEKMAALGRVATSLAHEVKNPAAAIRMHADLLRSVSIANVQTHSSLELIREEVDQITDLVNQWLYVSKSEPSALRTHNLVDLLNRVAKRMSGLLEDRGIAFKVDFDGDGLISIEADAPRIEQAIRNLIQNAIDAMPRGGELIVGIHRSVSGVIVEFRDTGEGFTEEALERFGEPFFSDKEGGMGIGLHLASEVARAHGGDVSAHNRKDRSGAVVSLALPTKRADTES